MADSLKIVLVEPGSEFAETGCDILSKQTPSLGLVSIATYLNKHGFSARVFDQQVGHRGKDPFPTFLKAFFPQVVGIQAYSYNLETAYQTAKLVRSIIPSTRILLGGVHPSVQPYETLQGCTEVDVVVIGEGEETLLEYCQSILDKTNIPIPGIINRDDNQFVLRPFIENLDFLPFPDWGILNYTMYHKAYSEGFQKMETLVPISSSRGCGQGCSYCVTGWLGNKIRMRSPESVVQEIVQNYDKGFRFFYFTDPNFLFNKNRVERICDLLHETIFTQRRGRIYWKCQSRACFADQKLFRKMRMNGCELIFFGIESGNDEVLRQNKPNQTREMVINGVLAARQAGLKVRGSFILGLPFDTKQSMEETLQFSQDLQLDGSTFHVLDIYPGTGLSKLLQKSPHWGGLTILEGGKFSRGTSQVQVNDATSEDIEEIRSRAIYQNFKQDASRIRKNLTELRYYLDHDKNTFQRILKDRMREISLPCKEGI